MCSDESIPETVDSRRHKDPSVLFPVFSCNSLFSGFLSYCSLSAPRLEYQVLQALSYFLTNSSVPNGNLPICRKRTLLRLFPPRSTKIKHLISFFHVLFFCCIALLPISSESSFLATEETWHSRGLEVE